MKNKAVVKNKNRAEKIAEDRALPATKMKQKTIHYQSLKHKCAKEISEIRGIIRTKPCCKNIRADPGGQKRAKLITDQVKNHNPMYLYKNEDRSDCDVFIGLVLTTLELQVV
jgi:hypothetical protein